jgi:DNA helicase IV
VLRHLPDKRPSRVIGLSVGYRIPEQIMDLANKVMRAATPELRAPTAVRLGDTGPLIVRANSPADLPGEVAKRTAELLAELPDGNVAVVAPDAMVETVSAALDEAGIDHGRATRTGLDMGVTVVPVSVVKGLELDGVVVVEPAAMVADEQQGLRALYVALTRATRRLTVVHSAELPAPMRS